MRNIPIFFRAKVVNVLHKLIALRASPHQIAIGFAIGVFIGIFPTFGLGGVVIIAIAPLWKFNVPASFIGTIIGNPLFAPLWITLSCLVTGISPSQIKLPKETFNQILAHYSQIGLHYLLGNAIVSFITAVISYFVLVFIIKWFRKRKELSDLPRLEKK